MYRAEHQPEIKAGKKIYYIENGDKVRADSAACAAANPERCKEQKRRDRADHPEKWAKRSADYYSGNQAECDARNKQWRIDNLEASNAIQAKSQRKHSATKNAATAKRRASKLVRTPIWSDIAEMKGIYVMAKVATKSVGIPMEVDHYYPLQGDLVSGLHVPANLQVISRRANKAKGNAYAPC